MATNTPARSCIAIKKIEAFDGINGSKLEIKITPVPNEQTRFKVKISSIERGFHNLDRAPRRRPVEYNIPLLEVITGFATVTSCIAGIYVVYKVGSLTKALLDAIKGWRETGFFPIVLNIKVIRLCSSVSLLEHDYNLPLGKFLLFGLVMKKKHGIIVKRLLGPCLRMLAQFSRK